jgi:hypothetical protein
VRKRIREACPDATETIKWNVPFYELSGKLVASMAAFKKHAKLGIWHGMRPEMVDVTTLAELPSVTEHAKKLRAAAEHARLIGQPAAQQATTKKSTAKKASAKEPTAKKASAKKASAKKAPIRKAPTKRAPAKKAPNKKRP